MKFENHMDKVFEKIGLEWQYVLWSRTYPYRFKVGRSTKFDSRIRDIRATMSQDAGKRVRVGVFVKVPLFFAGTSEKTIHNCALWRPADNMPGSGYTEWSWGLNPYCMALIYMASIGFSFPQYWALVVLFLPLPLDFAVITLILAAIQYFAAGVLIYGAWNIFF